MDDRFFKGIEEFNAGRYFEAHEVLEDLWHEYRESDRTFIQGLIQLSAGFYHFQCANWKGATSQLSKGITKLEPFRPEHLGVELSEFLLQIQQFLNSVCDLKEGKTTVIQPARLPKLIAGKSQTIFS